MTSRFGKTQGSVLRAAYDTIAAAVESGDAKLYRQLFSETFYVDSRGQAQRALLMTRDGFMLLATEVKGGQDDAAHH